MHRVYVVRNALKRDEACKPTVLADGRTVYRCSYCSKDFASYSDINRHMDFHEGRSPSSAATSASSSSSSSSLQQGVCMLPTVRYRSMEKHNNHQLIFGIKTLVMTIGCKICQGFENIWMVGLCLFTRNSIEYLRRKCFKFDLFCFSIIM